MKTLKRILRAYAALTVILLCLCCFYVASEMVSKSDTVMLIGGIYLYLSGTILTVSLIVIIFNHTLKTKPNEEHHE